MCTTSDSKRATGCLLILLSLAVIPAVLIDFAFSYYKVVSKEDLIDGKCYVHNVTVQERRSMYNKQIPSTGKEHRAYFDVDFEGGDEHFYHVAAIPATWQAGWAASNVHKYIKDYSKHKWHCCVGSTRTVPYDSNDKDSASYLVILGHSAHQLRRNFLGLLFSGIFIASIIVIGVIYVIVNFFRRKYAIQYRTIN